jgi:Peptidase family S41
MSERKKRFLGIILTITLLQYGKSMNARGQSCNCENNFLYIQESIAQNYIGFADKVTNKTKARYILFTDSIYTATKGAGALKCYQLLNRWLSFFNDPHINLYLNRQKMDSAAIRDMFKQGEKAAYDSSGFITYIQRAKIDPIEGIWTNAYTQTRYGIVRDKSDPKVFWGFMISADNIFWHPMQIRCKIIRKGKSYKLGFIYLRDHTPFKDAISVRNNVIYFVSGNIWTKVDQQTGEVKNKKFVLPPVNNPQHEFLKIDEQTCLIRIPSSSLGFRSTVDSIIEANKSVIETTDHLIIDLRENRGGSVLVTNKLLPYLYTQPYIYEGGSILSTKANIDEYRESPADSIKNIKIINQLESAGYGKTVMVYPPDTLRFDRVLEKPSAVSIIVNRYTASAAELFLLKARQSKKVTILGENTAGMVDYLDVGSDKSMPCPYWLFSYPLSRRDASLVNPIDGIGIKPDIYLNRNKDWIKAAISLYKKNGHF